jgi:hypothetical protein
MIEAVGGNEEREGVRREVDGKEGVVRMANDEAGVEMKQGKVKGLSWLGIRNVRNRTTVACASLGFSSVLWLTLLFWAFSRPVPRFCRLRAL